MRRLLMVVLVTASIIGAAELIHWFSIPAVSLADVSFVRGPIPARTRDILESLDSPVTVRGWQPDALILDDGRRLAIPGIQELPPASRALSEVLQRGLEVGRKGELTALMEIWHWCGNDPVSRHVARIDLPSFLLFYDVGTPTGDLARVATSPKPKVEGRFTIHGWDVREYSEYRRWREGIEAQADVAPSNYRTNPTAGKRVSD